jgi:hypothetical protein
MSEKNKNFGSDSQFVTFYEKGRELIDKGFKQLNRKGYLLAFLLVTIVICLCLIILLIRFSRSVFSTSPDASLQQNGALQQLKPPHLGVFLFENNSYIEMKRYTGRPAGGEGIPITSNPNPTIVMWYPEVELSQLRL